MSRQPRARQTKRELAAAKADAEKTQAYRLKAASVAQHSKTPRPKSRPFNKIPAVESKGYEPASLALNEIPAHAAVMRPSTRVAEAARPSQRQDVAIRTRRLVD